MLRKAIVFGIGVCMAMSLLAEDGMNWKTAMGLYHQGKYQEAQDGFVKLADEASTPQSKADCLAYAALSLKALKKDDDAVAMAKKIEIKPVSINCQMKIMKSEEIAVAFKDEDFDAWPEELKGEGFYRRGYAYSKVKNYEAAIKDLDKAADLFSDERAKLNSLSELTVIYGAMKDDQKALDTHKKIQALVSLKGTPAYNDSSLSSTNILIRQAKYDEALANLQNIALDKSVGDMKFHVLKAYGEIFEAQGKKPEALAKYKEAVEIKVNLPPSFIEEMQKKISALSEK